MYIEKGVLIAILLVTVFFAVAWLYTYHRAGIAERRYETLGEEEAKLKLTISRLSKDIDSQKSKRKEQDSLLMEIGTALVNVKNPLATLRRIYEILERQNMALVANSPLAFVNRQGKNTFSTTDSEGREAFERIKNNLGT